MTDDVLLKLNHSTHNSKTKATLRLMYRREGVIPDLERYPVNEAIKKAGI